MWAHNGWTCTDHPQWTLNGDKLEWQTAEKDEGHLWFIYSIYGGGGETFKKPTKKPHSKRPCWSDSDPHAEVGGTASELSISREWRAEGDGGGNHCQNILNVCSFECSLVTDKLNWKSQKSHKRKLTGGLSCPCVCVCFVCFLVCYIPHDFTTVLEIKQEAEAVEPVCLAPGMKSSSPGTRSIQYLFTAVSLVVSFTSTEIWYHISSCYYHTWAVRWSALLMLRLINVRIKLIVLWNVFQLNDCQVCKIFNRFQIMLTANQVWGSNFKYFVCPSTTQKLSIFKSQNWGRQS